MIHLLLSFSLAADPAAAAWEKAEAVHLKNIKQLTFDFVRAGEGYFAPDGKAIIFQAEEKDKGNPFYQIFVQDLATGSYRRISPGVDRTTCAAFSPDGKKVIFASSHLDPDAKKHQEAEYKKREDDRQKKLRRRYSWDFDPYMEIFEADLQGGHLKNLTNSKGYDAEGSFSADGKRIVFCSNRDGHLNLYIMDADGGNVRQLTKTKDCYNGGPFFSPDGTKVIFRSDRKEKDRLQIYVINADGTGEKALTDNDKWVYWAPYWFKDGKHIIYTAADHSDEMARPNYDLYWMRLPEDAKDVKDKSFNDLRPERFSPNERISLFSPLSQPILYRFRTAEQKHVRITYAPGADVLPVFSPDYKRLMWTASRDAAHTSQLYIADFIAPKDD